mmetsp:Transcript_32952/g.75894  ORF Transcript_32952/g.75894 Transcript_32952/m.75894 type:complete len:159 (-) Transcript_32952:749-1225(-)
MQHDSVFRRVELTPRDLATYAHFEPTRNYTRNLVATDGKHFTLLLLCWNPGHESPIHNHPCDGCWMKVVKGTVQECRYEESSQHQTQPQQEEQTLTCILDNLYHGMIHFLLHATRTIPLALLAPNPLSLPLLQRMKARIFEIRWDITRWAIRVRMSRP